MKILNDFFQLIWQLEREKFQWNLCDKMTVVGKIKCYANNALTFPSRIINAINDESNNLVEIIVNYLGLVGVDSPLPFYWLSIAQENSDQAEKVCAFLNIFQQRIYYLYYLSWKKHQIIIQHEQKNSPLHNCLQAISGGILQTQPQREFACASLFGQRIHNATSLLTILNHFNEGTIITVRQFIPKWILMSQTHCMERSKLILGRNSLIGHRLLSISQCILIEFGPIHLQNTQLIINHYVTIHNLLDVIKKYTGLLYQIEIMLHFFIEKHFCLLLGKQPNFLGRDMFLGNVINRLLTFRLV